MRPTNRVRQARARPKPSSLRIGLSKTPRFLAVFATSYVRLGAGWPHGSDLISRRISNKHRDVPRAKPDCSGRALCRSRNDPGFEPGARPDRYQQEAALTEVGDKCPPDSACCEWRETGETRCIRTKAGRAPRLCGRTAVRGSDRETRGACNIH